MSTMKKLSLSGFKSTFKRKTNRGNSRNNLAEDRSINAQQAIARDGLLSDGENSTANGHYKKNGKLEDTFMPKAGNFIIANENEEVLTTLVNNAGHFSHCGRANGVKICDRANGNIVKTMNIHDIAIAETGSEDNTRNRHRDCTTTNEPGSAVSSGLDVLPSPLDVDPVGENGWQAAKPEAKAKQNGNVLSDANSNEPSRNSNETESIYVGPRGSFSLHIPAVPPHLGNRHTFQEVNTVRHSHDYINDDVQEASSGGKDGETDSMNLSQSPDMKGPRQKCDAQQHCSDGVSRSKEANGDNSIRPQCSDENVNVIPIPPRPHRRKNPQSPCQHADTLLLSGGASISGHAVLEDDSPPPAIPPKPAALFNDGHWKFDATSASRPHSEEDQEVKGEELKKPDSDAEDDIPPRPPARTRTRIGVDISLPFYKEYLEQSEKAFHPPPVYEAVRLDSGPVAGGLAGELSKLPRQPWYWGPMAQDEAEEKLGEASDGSFLVRDSSDERYLLTLSFKSNGRCLHTRIEHRNGLFSLNDSEGHASVIDLIHSAVRESEKGVFGYMNDSMGIQNYPARLTHWISRFSEVKSLQHLCRFVIRETYPRHHIRKLPLPRRINEYVLENQY